MSVLLPEPKGENLATRSWAPLTTFLSTRFQQKQYANIEIVLTEKKGYGLRAEENLPKSVFSHGSSEFPVYASRRDSFIYEYVGDVVNPVSFKKRMREYAEEGIRHFYFMMLQKDEVRSFNYL